MLSDFRFALRVFLRSPGFTFVTVATFAIGIAAATAIFSIFNAVVLQPLPYHDPDRAVRLYQTKPDEPRDNHSGPDFLDFQAQATSVLARSAAYREAAFNLSGRGAATRLDAIIVTPEYFEVLGVRASRGRTFIEDDAKAPVRPVVLSHSAWQKHFGGSDAVVGSTIRLNQAPHVVVGVMAPDFPAGAAPGVWVVSKDDLPETPFPDPRDLEHNRSVHYLSVIARLRPGVSLESAQSAVSTVAARLAKQYPDSNGNRGARLVPLHEDLVGDVRPALLLLLTAVGLVLAVVAVNIASLMLARGAARQKEIAVRAALGGGRWRLVRQMLAESVVIGALGGVAGLVLAMWGLDLLLALAPVDIPRLSGARLDLEVFAFGALLSLGVALAIGVLSAFGNSRPDLTSVLRQAGAGSLSRTHRLRAVLVTAQVAAAVVLLVSAVLVGRSFLNLQRVQLGFDIERVFVAGLPLPETEYREEYRQRQFFQALLPRLATLPGVEAAAAVFPSPFSGGAAGAGFEIEGKGNTTGGQRNYAALSWVTPDFFRVLRIPVLDGRGFTDRDIDKAPKVIVINRSMANRFWPGERALGKRIRFTAGDDQPWFEVVGIAADTRSQQPGTAPEPAFYVAHAQSALPFMSVIVRTSGEGAGLAGGLRSEVARLDPNLPVGTVEPLEKRLGEQVAPPRFRSLLLLLFGGAALLLAGLGVYGVISYSVARRRPEIGIRLALGATPTQVRALVMRQGLLLTTIGIVAGLAASAVASRWLRTLLYGVSASDPTSVALVVLVLAMVAAGATYLPTRRAVRINPVEALRTE